jgi:hypothetical protein
MADSADGARQYLQREQIMPWIEAAQSARLNADVLERLMPPREGSYLLPSSDAPVKKVAWWCHGYLDAAADHLLLWADYAAPLKFHPESETVHTLRPAFTLARAAIESAAQVIWALAPEEPSEFGRRFFQLVLWETSEQAKAAATPETRAEHRTRLNEMLSVFGQTTRTFKPPKYLDLVRFAAEFLTDGDSTSPMSPDRIERIWRSAAGAAHGKQWPEYELSDREDAGDGLYYSTPKIEAISEVLEIASKFLSAGVILFAIRAGRQEDFDDLWREATTRLAERITTIDGEPVRPGATPDSRLTKPPRVSSVMCRADESTGRRR